MSKALLFLFLFISGCAAVGPDYTEPDLDLPQEWNQAENQGMLPDQAIVRQWWLVFEDPVLTTLIEQAAEQNLDLQIAVARLDEARARLRMTAGDYLPTLDAQGSVTRQESRPSALDPGGTTDTYYAAGMEAGWELDLFGRIRRSVQASTADYQASREERTDVMISMYSQLASTYVDIRTLQTRLRTAQANIQSQEEILSLTKSRYKHGLATGLDVAQAEMVLANTRAAIPPLRIELQQSMNAMDVLLGSQPGTARQFLDGQGSIPLPPESVGSGVPADILRQRPDIRKAERELAAQTARIGMAEALLYPRLSLNGSFNYTAADLDDIFTSAARTFLFGPTLSWNVFNAGKTRARIEMEEARAEQALLAYRLTVLQALSEVESAMTGYREQKKRLDSLHNAVLASRKSLHMAEKLYKDGLADFQNVLDAQRSLYSAEDQMDTAKGNAALFMVTLYKALGGGWNSKTGSSGVSTAAGESVVND
ncbi:MAG: efflux transporter outer membrane subunit [Desulfovermiculus sp.]